MSFNDVTVLFQDTLATFTGFSQLSSLDQIEQKLVEGEYAPEIKEYLLPHVDLIFRCACRLTRKAHDAEDLTQEAFYYAIKNFAQLKDRAKAKNWLFSILRNLFLKDLEKNKKQVNIDFDAVSNTISGLSNVEEEHLKEEVSRNLRAVLNKLDDRLKAPIVMFYFDRLTYKEIAKTLNLPMGTVMSRIARGKVYIRRELNRTGNWHS
ncbi:MAG: sigma-70 family RNA polymerase sigma factor [Nitrospinaceae bacterium]